MIASQILPFGDGKVMGLWGQVEAGLYQALNKDPNEGVEEATESLGKSSV